MKNEQQTTFHKKLQAKKGQKSSLSCFNSYKSIFMASNFFWWNFFAIFSKVLHSVWNSACLDTHFLFYQQHFIWGIISTFWTLWSQKKKKWLNMLKLFIYKCGLKFYFASIFPWITKIFLSWCNHCTLMLSLGSPLTWFFLLTWYLTFLCKLVSLAQSYKSSKSSKRL